MQQAQVINTNNFVMAADQNQQNQVGGALTEGSNDDGKTPKNVDGRKFVKGSVKFYNRTKSFGFIHGDDGQDYFVHESCIVTQFSSDVEKGLDDKQRVCFNPQIDTRSNKFRAVNVTILDDQAVGENALEFSKFDVKIAKFLSQFTIFIKISFKNQKSKNLK